MIPLDRRMKPVPYPWTTRAPSGTKKKSQGDRGVACWRDVTLIETTARDTRSAAVTSAVRRETSIPFWAEATRDDAWAPAVATLSSRLGASRHPVDARPIASRRLTDRRGGMGCLDGVLEQLRR